MTAFDIKADESTGIEKLTVKGRAVKAWRVPFEAVNVFCEKNDNEINDAGVYLLIKDSDSDPCVYVGEAEPLTNRLKQHCAKRSKGEEFAWTEALLFVNQVPPGWTKADIKFLEHCLHHDLIGIKRYRLINGNVPQKSKVSDAELCMEHLSQITASVRYLGHPKLFLKTTNETPTPPPKPKHAEPFKFSMIGLKKGDKVAWKKDGKATATVVDDSHVMYRGKTYSLSALAMLLIGKEQAVQGPAQFTFNGKTLTDLRAEAGK